MHAKLMTGAVIVGSCLLACGPGRAGESETSGTTGGESGSLETGGEDTSSDETGPGPDECQLAIRIDLCCNQAFAATPAEVAAEACVVAWPIDWQALDAGLVGDCVAQQPDWCEVVDCDYAQPASEEVGLGADGSCTYLCPEDLSLAYQYPGCGQPPPVVECLPPPPPCADEYCSCAGETIFGCGQLGEPFEHIGACE